MKFHLNLALLFFLSPAIFGQKTVLIHDSLSFDSVLIRINQLQTEINYLRENLDKFESDNRTLSELFARSNETISNQLTESSNFLQIWGYIAAVIGIVFAIYITGMQNKVSKIFKESKIIFRDQIRTRQEMKKTQDLINNNLSKLYSQLQEEEINYLIERIKNVPEDFENIFNRLAVINIPKKYFQEFKKLIIGNDVLIDETKQKHYIITLTALSIQHFPIETINDNALREIMLKELQGILLCLFVKEIDGLIESICLFIGNQPLKSNLALITALLNELQTRNENELPIIAKSIWNHLKTLERREELKKLFEGNESTKHIISEFLKIK